MGRPKKSWWEYAYGPERDRTLKSRLFVLLRDELGLGQQPKVARLLVDEILAVVESTLVNVAALKPGQLVVLAPEVGQRPSFLRPTVGDKKMKTVILTLIAEEDIDRLVARESQSQVRKQRMVRLLRESFEQGATLTSCQLAVIVSSSVTQVNKQLRQYMQQTGKVLPLRGIVEDCSPGVSHKEMIIKRHLEGQSTSEIARATNHAPNSVERYVRRFEQIHELIGYLGDFPDPTVIARILGCSERLVRTYLALLSDEQRTVGAGGQGRSSVER